MTVKNKTPAPIQITAEQILREAHEFRETPNKVPRQKITDPEELDHYRLTKRKEFENTLRRQRHNMGAWMRYAKWEASQNQFVRARSIFERALDVDYKNQTVWLKYAEMEQKNKFVNSARNVWDRAVSLLPRVAQFWTKFALMEEMLGEVGNARQIFERWMEWEPGKNGWQSYIKLEMRHHNEDKARAIFERWLNCHPEMETYFKFAKFETKLGNPDKAREVYERASNDLDEEEKDEKFFIPFAAFEERQGEFERARGIYRYALDHLPKHKAKELFQTYCEFEKQHGNKESVEHVVLSKRRFKYEEDVAAHPTDYDTWFDYIRLEEQAGDPVRIREVYERAVANVPPIQEKIYWKRYIFLWVYWAIYEELTAKDLERTEQVYKRCIELIPHKAFTFSKMWVMLASFYGRQRRFDMLRKVFGTAIGKCPREKLFKSYIGIERKLGEIDRSRALYQKWLEFEPSNSDAWIKFASMEEQLSEFDRARSLFEVAVSRDVMDVPAKLWKAYIDLEIRQKQPDRVRKLYRRLLQKATHVKVWISFAQFEASLKQLANARAIFNEASAFFKGKDELREERATLLEKWQEFETNFGDAQALQKVLDVQPKKLRRKRKIFTEYGDDAGFEEYIAYQFPDDKPEKQGSLKILEMAKKWKRAKLNPPEEKVPEPAAASMDEDAESDGED